MTTPSLSLLTVQQDHLSPTKYLQPLTQQVQMHDVIVTNISFYTKYYQLLVVVHPVSLFATARTLTSITVHWGEIPCSERNGEITGYFVRSSSTIPPHNIILSVSGSNTLTTTVTWLVTSYCVHLFSVGRGSSYVHCYK